MKWVLIVATVVLCAFLVHAEPPKSAKPTKPSASLDPVHHHAAAGLLADKSQKKRGLFSPVPTFSQGYDYPVVTHSFLKPFVVDYPVQSVPVGVKIPFKKPGASQHFNQFQLGHKLTVPYPAYGLKFPSHPFANAPSHTAPAAVKPGWRPACAHSHPVVVPVKPIIPLPAPLIPATSVHVPTNLVPSLTPVLPLPHPPLPFISRPHVFRPILPVQTPIIAPAHIAPAHIAPAHFAPALAPVPHIPHHVPVHVPPPVHSVVRPGNSLHTSYFATFPKYPFVNSLPAIKPVVPLASGHVPLNVHGHVPFNVGHVPLNVGHFPVNVARPPVVFNQVPANIPVNFGHFPVNVGHFPVNVGHAHHVPAHVPVPGPAPSNVPFNVGQIPVGQIPIGQNPFFFQRPEVNFPPQVLPLDTPRTPTIVPGVQQQGNNNVNGFAQIPQIPATDNVWTPMTPTPENFPPTAQYPNEPQFIPQEPVQPTFQPEDTNIQGNEQGQGYHYQQNGYQSFQEGTDQQIQQQQLQHQLQQQRLQQQQYQQEEFEEQQIRQQQNDQQEQFQEQDQFQNQNNHQNLHEQHRMRLMQLQRDQERFQNIEHHGNPQHQPQLPQSLPAHPLAGRPINEAFQNQMAFPQGLPFRRHPGNFQGLPK